MAKSTDVYRQILELVKIYDDPAFEKLSLLDKVFKVAAQVSAAACAILTDLQPERRAKAVPRVVATAEWVFDEYVAAIDFPINDVVERFLEKRAKIFIRDNIVNWMDQLDA
jgi:hypothetical protein